MGQQRGTGLERPSSHSIDRPETVRQQLRHRIRVLLRGFLDSWDSWTVKEVGSGPIAYEFGTAIALDMSYNPQLAWYDDTAKELKRAVKSGDSWEISTVDSEGDVGRYPALVIDNNNSA